MITPEMIARINELARKKREGVITEEELAEQTVLRRLYIDHIKSQVRDQLEAVSPHPKGCDCKHHKH